MPLLRTHTFHIQPVSFDEGVYGLRITTNNRPHLECVSLLVDGTVLVLEGIEYYKECNRSLQRGSGTMDMIKAAIRYAAASFPHLQTVQVSDETFFPTPTRPLITARRLLLGMPGWYQEHLGAVPTPETHARLLKLRTVLAAHPDVMAELQSMVSRPEMFTPDYVMSVCRRLRVRSSTVIGTTWNIPLETVMSWEMPAVREDETLMSGGGVVEWIPWPSIECPFCF